MRDGRDICKALAGFLLGVALTGCGSCSDKTGGAAVEPDSTQPNPTAPAIAAIKVYFKQDPRLTRGRQMGDRWLAPPTFMTTRYPGRQLTVDAKATGVNDQGKLLVRRLEAEWLPGDPDHVVVSPSKGSEVTITIQSPGESELQVTRGELSETFTLRATYDEKNDLTQLVISRDVAG